MGTSNENEEEIEIFIVETLEDGRALVRKKMKKVSELEKKPLGITTTGAHSHYTHVEGLIHNDFSGNIDYHGEPGLL